MDNRVVRTIGNASDRMKDDPIRITYDHFQHEFGPDNKIFLLVQSEGDIFDQNYLSRLKALHEDIEDNVPKVQDVNSLINAGHGGIHGHDVGIHIDNFSSNLHTAIDYQI